MTDLRQLAHDLDQLREDLDYVTALLEPHLADPAGVPPGVSVTSGGGTPFRSNRAHVWNSLTPREAGRGWDTLTEWVDWLLDRYALDDTIPDCWYQHGAITDELDALRAAWVTAYLDPGARPVDAAYWHDLLDRALSRLRNWDRYGCSSGTHHDDTPTPSDPASRQARTDHLYTDIDSRTRRLHSVPTEDPATG